MFIVCVCDRMVRVTATASRSVRVRVCACVCTHAYVKPSKTHLSMQRHRPTRTR